MSRLPVIVGCGGVNPAGRVSSHHAYKRMVIDKLPEAEALTTYQALAGLMQLSDDPAKPLTQQYIRDNTLIREIENFDLDTVVFHQPATLSSGDNGVVEFRVAKRQLPSEIPDNWQIKPCVGEDEKFVQVRVSGDLPILFHDKKTMRVSSAGQLPRGFDPSALYPSRSHPRGLQLTIYAASDALRSTGIELDTLKALVPPDQFSVYSASAQGQLDSNSFAGVFQSRLLGKRVTSKQIALGLPEMPGDFVNAYVLGSAGSTGAIIGACATYLYNLRQGVEDIRSGKARIVVVGNSEAPVLPDNIEAYRTMGALTEDEELMALDGSATPDLRRACRPFAENAGFVVAEGAIYTILMDDELAIELGAEIYGSVGGVYVSADGYKKSIPGPGIGNYLTVAKALSLARSIIGETSLRNNTYMQAHGTGTPQNRVTESHILNELAKSFGINRWPVAAIKSYLGHTMAPAGADSLSAILGAWQHGLIPGITTIDKIADDVYQSNLDFAIEHIEFDPQSMHGAFVNSKGFGGNNATGFFLSPFKTKAMLLKKHGQKAFDKYQDNNLAVKEAAAAYDLAATNNEIQPIYQFGEGVLKGEDLSLSDKEIKLPGFEKPVALAEENPYSDMT